MTIYITSGERPSNSRLALQKQGGFRKLKYESKITKSDVLINWGCGSLPQTGQLFGVQIINIPHAIGVAANKLTFFQNIGQLSTVPWTTDKSVAQGWLNQEKTVVVRNKLTGHSGDGIVIVEPGQTLPTTPLYTQYVHKKEEYRVHVVGGKVVDIQRKIRDPKQEPKTWKVRSHANGFIFVRNNITISSQTAELAVAATVACGLDFGAVDIVVDKHGTPYLLEINTAPGLEGSSIDNYVTALNGLISAGNS